MRLVNQSYKTRRCVWEGKEEPPPSEGLVFNCIIDAHGSREEHGRGGCCLKRWHCTIEQHKFTNCISREREPVDKKCEGKNSSVIACCIITGIRVLFFRARQGLFCSFNLC